MGGQYRYLKINGFVCYVRRQRLSHEDNIIWHVSMYDSETVCKRRYLAKHGSVRLRNTQSVSCRVGHFHDELSTVA